MLAATAVGIAAALVAVAAYVTVRVQMRESIDESLLQRAQAAAEASALSSMTRASVPSWALGAADVRIAFLTPGQPPISADRGPTLVLGEPELDVAEGRRARSVRTIEAQDGTRFRVAAVAAGEESALVIAQSLEPIDDALGRLATVLVAFGGLGAVLASIAGWAVARTGLRPVRRLTRAVERVAKTEDLRPIPVEGEDDIARLAAAFNDTLTALADSLERQRQLVADASHELRTPLTSLRTNLELLIQADAKGGLSPRSRAELLDDVQAQINELTTLITDVTELAREGDATTTEPIDLAEVVRRAAARVTRRALTQTITLDVEPWWVLGERVALERAVTNLLDNAVKWNAPQGVVSVSLHDGTLTVDDQGPGIADADLPHVFERFYRSVEARNMPGSGLGLSIVQHVAARHGGTVSANRTDQGGARVQFRIPGTSQPP